MIKTGNKNFWIAQLVGWGLFAVANFTVQYTASDSLKMPLLNSAISFAVGIFITSLYRHFIKKVNLSLIKFGKTLLIIIASSIFLTINFLIVIGVLFYIFVDQRLLTGMELLGNSFMFCILFLMWNSIYFMVHYLHNWKNAESEKWQLAATMKEAQLGNLKAQVNPHFMFNAINNIRALITEDPEKAKEMLLNFSDMFRYSLVHTDNSMVTIEEELEIVEKYLEIHSIQFETKLKYKIKSDPLLNERKIPPMIIQLLVENAIKHGISELPEGGEVIIDVHDGGAQLIIQVKNSGILDKSTSIQQKLGVGLQNIKERLALIYGGKTQLELSENAGFVTAQINIPLV